MKNKLKINFKDKKTIIISILLGLILINLIIFICTKVFHKDKELTPDDPTTKEFENYLKDAIKPFDEETIKDFISSTDNISTVDDFYWGVNYNGDISNDEKVLYTLSRMVYKDSNIIDYMTGANMFSEDTRLGDIKLSIKFINKALNAKFADTTLEKNTVISEGFFNGINAVICDDKYCIIPVSQTTDSGLDSDGVYASSLGNLEKTSSGYQITAETYYYEMSFEGVMKLGVYNNEYKDVTYCETSMGELYFSDLKSIEACKNVTYPKVKYTFDKDYKFVNAEFIS